MMRMMTMTPYHRVRVTLHTDYLGSKIRRMNGLGIGGGGTRHPHAIHSHERNYTAASCPARTIFQRFDTIDP